MAYIYKVTIVERQKVMELPLGLRLLVRRICISVLTHEKFNHSADVSVVFVDNDYIQSLNKQYKGRDVPTDMLSFPAIKNNDCEIDPKTGLKIHEYEINPETGAKILGDIIISFEKALEEAKIYVVPVQDIIMRWTAHSLLHLLGYDHEKTAYELERMRTICEAIVNKVSVPNSFCDVKSYKSK